MLGLDVAGVPLEGMAAAVRDGSLSFSYLDASAFDQFAEVSDTTFRQLRDQTGIPMEVMKMVDSPAHGRDEMPLEPL